MATLYLNLIFEGWGNECGWSIIYLTRRWRISIYSVLLRWYPTRFSASSDITLLDWMNFDITLSNKCLIFSCSLHIVITHVKLSHYNTSSILKNFNKVTKYNARSYHSDSIILKLRGSLYYTVYRLVCRKIGKYVILYMRACYPLRNTV